MMQGIEKKKESKVKRFFELVLFFFSILVLLALVYFELPWKTILLLIFIFYINFLIPKQHKKKITIFYWVVLLAIVVWIFLPEEQEGWRPYICYEKILQHEQQCLIPDEENAALLYNQIFESTDMDEFRNSIWDVNDILLDSFWTSSDYPDTADLLDEYSTVIDQIFEAVKLNRCYFSLLKDDFQMPVNYKEVADFWFRPQEEVSLRYIGDFLLLSANNDVSNGKVSLALKKYFAVFQIASHLSQRSEVTDVLLRMSLEMKTFSCLHNLLLTEDLDSEDSGEIKERLKTVNHRWETEISKVFEREKLRNKSFMYAMLYQINASDNIRYNRDPNSTLSSIIVFDPDPYDAPEAWLDRHPRVKDYLKLKTVKASLLFTNFFVPLNINKTENIFDKNLAFYDEMLSPDYDWKEKGSLFTWKTTKINFSYFSKLMFEGIMGGYYEKVYDVFLKTEAVKQATQIIIELKRFKDKAGHWPESLDVISDELPDEVLIDPMNGGPFVYRTEGDSFIFYSRGKNNVDEYDQLLWRETADPNDIDYSQPRPDDIVIWPPMNN